MLLLLLLLSRFSHARLCAKSELIYLGEKPFLKVINVWMAIEALGAGDPPPYNVESGQHNSRGLRHKGKSEERATRKEVSGWRGQSDALGVKDREDLQSCIFPQKLSPFLPTEHPNLLTPTREERGAEHEAARA